MWHQEEPEPLDSEEERRRQEEYWRELEAKYKRQKAEAAERRRLEEQRLQALERRLWEENRRQELLEEEGENEGGGERELQLEADVRQGEEWRWRQEGRGGQGQGQEEQELERRHLEVGEQKHLEEEAEPLESLAQQEELEEQRWQEAGKQRQEEEERGLKELRRLEELEAGKQRQEEEERRLGEPRQQQELEEQRQQEEEEKRMKELRRQEELEEQRQQEEEAANRREELSREQEETEVQRPQEADNEPREASRLGAGSQREQDNKRGARSPLQTDFAEKPEQEHLGPERQRENSEEPSVCEKQSQEAEPSQVQQGKRGDFQGEDRCEHQEKEEEVNPPLPQKQEVPVGERQAPVKKKEAAPPEKDRKVEELRWQEVDERQSMPRPYTFQVSSGGKQILFPKVNLSPVTLVKDAGLASTAHEPKAPKASAASHALPSALSIPHTAILVTGAQLCGPAVNLSQIKDTACKSLLGLSEEKKHTDVPALENPPRAPTDPRAGSGKTRPHHESPSSVAALAEWASIRSRILKNADGDQRSKRDPSQPGDEHTPRGRCDSRGNLRKTPPVNAKFSIMPAWQKFSDGGMETSKQNIEPESIRKRPMLGAGDETEPPLLAADTNEHQKGAEKLGVHQEPTDTTEGCKFAKDLPSFLVPSLPHPPQKATAHAEAVISSDSETSGGMGKPDPMTPGGEEKASPFGIKLRRTNYSLRFHCDQQTEQKKKKRHSSTGDSADGGPPAPGSTDGEKETEGVALKHGPSLPSERKQAPSSRKDSAESPSSLSPAAQPGSPVASSQTLAPEHDKVANRMPLAQKPALAPKPTSQTPPSSPLCKLSRPYLVELLARRPAKPDAEPSEPCSAPPPLSPPPTEERKAQRRAEEEQMETERKAASPALSAAQQEKSPQAPETGRKGT